MVLVRLSRTVGGFMTREGGGRPPVLVISDDEELGGLIARSLRHRQLLVELTDFSRAAAPRWSPANGRPVVVVIDVEKPSTDPVAFLRAARRQPWLSGLPIVLATDHAAEVITKVGDGAGMLPTRLDDVGAIVTAVLFFVATSSHVAEPVATDLIRNER
jgi:DNA-binding response OmpR family regulator